jgi:hypothetical protein
MSWPENHMRRNSFYFPLYSPLSYLKTRKDSNFLTEEEKQKLNQVYDILKDLCNNRYKRYWELKKEERNKNG